jgi:WD40 repeat protein
MSSYVSTHSKDIMMSSSNPASNVWQEILSLDAKFNLYRINSNAQLRTQYMRRRTQLMRESSARHASRPEAIAERRAYLNIRSQILERKYGQLDQVSVSSQSQKGVYVNNRTYRTSQNADSISLNSDSNYGGKQRYAQNFSNMAAALNPQQSSFLYSSKESLNNHPNTSANSKPNSRSSTLYPIDDNSTYAQAGVDHVFEAHKGAVTRVRFANNDKSLLASTSIDGSLCIYQVIPSPATMIYKLEGHQAGIMDFQWSTTNDLIVTASLDGTSRVWQVAKGKCMRMLKDTSAAQVLCCCFQPLNENMIFTGNSKGFIQVNFRFFSHQRLGSNFSFKVKSYL